MAPALVSDRLVQATVGKTAAAPRLAETITTVGTNYFIMLSLVETSLQFRNFGESVDAVNKAVFTSAVREGVDEAPEIFHVGAT